jgi:hypothetical protein
MCWELAAEGVRAVDPVTIGAVLAAVAGGTGGALGAQLWSAVNALVRRPFHRRDLAQDPAAAVPSGQAELAALAQVPSDQQRALALAEVLVARAEADGEFRQALEGWWAQASQIHIGGDVTNTISRGTFHGPVLQGRNFTGLTFGSSAPAPLSSYPQEPSA